MSGVNPQGCQVYSYKPPSEEELDHDFLWRAAKALPERGRIGIFNRSHYEEVLVVRVHPELLERERLPAVPKGKELWEQRYESINAFEQHLVRNGTAIVKFFLHISKDEQEQRLLSRENDPVDAWKLSVDDWKQREQWDEFTEAYEDAISRCAAPHAPWCVVPADAKWYRNLVVAESIAAALRPFREKWLATLDEEGKRRRTALEAWRRQRKAAKREGAGSDPEE
jgi:PPK2 family polyphosphate:nucleotide phosphotransferase